MFIVDIVYMTCDICKKDVPSRNPLDVIEFEYDEEIFVEYSYDDPSWEPALEKFQYLESWDYSNICRKCFEEYEVKQ